MDIMCLVVGLGIVYINRRLGMKVKTRNSTYRVLPLGSYFEVEKIAGARPNKNGICLGWKMKATTMQISIGNVARFSSVHISDFLTTTEVLEVQP
jgi:hypothetical protein